MRSNTLPMTVLICVRKQDFSPSLCTTDCPFHATPFVPGAMPCGCGAGGCGAGTSCSCQRDGRMCTMACHGGDHGACGNLDATATLNRLLWSSWVGGVGLALFFVWLAISLNIGTGGRVTRSGALHAVMR